MALEQLELIKRVKMLCQKDTFFDAVLMYGSFTQDEGDAYSDIEFWLFLEDDVFPGFDEALWINRIAPTFLIGQHEFSGATTVIFDTLIRAELHFEPASQMAQIRDWPLENEDINIRAMCVLDRRGNLEKHLNYLQTALPRRLSKEKLQQLIDVFLNQYLFGINVLARGERARSHELLHSLQRSLLFMLRVIEGKTDAHWLTPSKKLEEDVSAESYMRFAKTCSNLSSLESAYLEAWTWGKSLIQALSSRYSLNARKLLISQLNEYIKELAIGTK